MISLLSIRFPNVSRATRATFDESIGPWLRGIAQIAFCGDAPSGVLVLAAACAVSPSSAAAAAIGGAVATLVNRPSRGDPQDEWRAGLTGYNGAIIGLLWGGALAQGGIGLALFPFALAIGLLIERPIARQFAAWNLPPLAVAATLVGWGSHLAYGALGLSFWHHPGALPLGDAGLALACALIFLALWRTRPSGAILTAVLALLIAVLFDWQTEFDAVALAGLWAFTAAPIVFALYGVYLVDSRGAGAVTFLACVPGVAVSALWFAYLHITPVPPLLAPFMLTVWATLWSAGRIAGARERRIAVDQAVAAIIDAQSSGRRVVALTGAGVSTASGIPDYVSGAWLEGAPTERGYDFQGFLDSAETRRAYWRSCVRFFDTVAGAVPNASHDALAAMMQAGRLSAVITQNVDRLHSAAGTRHVIELHGRIDWRRCLGCGARNLWDGAANDTAGDITCDSCGGLLKPDVVVLGENIPPMTWSNARNAVRQCGVILVIGTRLAISSAYQLVTLARRDGAKVIFVNTDPLSSSAQGSDIVVEGPAEEILPAIMRKLSPPHDRA